MDHSSGVCGTPIVSDTNPNVRSNKDRPQAKGFFGLLR